LTSPTPPPTHHASDPTDGDETFVIADDSDIPTLTDREPEPDLRLVSSFDPDEEFDWRPPEDLVSRLVSQNGIPREFVLDANRLYEFTLYWRDRPEPRARWPAKFFSKIIHDWQHHRT